MDSTCIGKKRAWRGIRSIKNSKIINLWQYHHIVIDPTHLCRLVKNTKRHIHAAAYDSIDISRSILATRNDGWSHWFIHCGRVEQGRRTQICGTSICIHTGQTLKKSDTNRYFYAVVRISIKVMDCSLLDLLGKCNVFAYDKLLIVRRDKCRLFEWFPMLVEWKRFDAWCVGFSWLLIPVLISDSCISFYPGRVSVHSLHTV